MVSLHGAVTLAESHHISKFIPHDLNLYMTRILDEFLDIHGIVAKCIGRLSLRHIKLEFEFVGGFCYTHSLSAAA